MNETLRCRTAADFVQEVASLTFANAFNPYRDRCPEFDLPNGPQIRRQNLTHVLSSALDLGITSVWIGRDLGYRGGRRTGLPLTDEIHIPAYAQLLGTAPLTRATAGVPVAERTAREIWRALSCLRRRIFLWNLFPLHPHQPKNALSNRCHTRGEREACRPLLHWLLGQLQPVRIIAIGRDAQTALEQMGILSSHVRHPSYGGHKEFARGIRDYLLE
jgi:hypothetical protein